MVRLLPFLTPATWAAGMHIQYNSAVTKLFGVQTQDNDVIYARVREGRVFLYGSMIHNGTGDPSYVPGVRTRGLSPMP